MKTLYLNKKEEKELKEENYSFSYCWSKYKFYRAKKLEAREEWKASEYKDAAKKRKMTLNQNKEDFWFNLAFC